MVCTKPFKQICCQLSHDQPSALYFHIPFCLAKCRYCDFYSLSAASQHTEQLVWAELAELEMFRSCLLLPLKSVFLGGGTPTALPADQLQRLLTSIYPMIDDQTEFSVEANPGTVNPALAKILKSAGVTRVNLGVQSFHDNELQSIGRIHSAAQAVEAVNIMLSARLDNIGLDLIYGLPNQTLEKWQASLDRALQLRPNHLSCYALSYEQGTAMSADLAAGRIEEMPDSLQQACYHAAIDACKAAGLQHYEISNFARNGFQCRHNLTYWHNRPYLGIGPAAASYVGGIRKTNRPHLGNYLAAVSAGNEPPCDCEYVIGRQLLAETLMLELRLMAGVSRSDFARRFAVDPLEAFPHSFNRYASQGAVTISADNIRIADSALFVADTILADILAEA